MKAVILAGGLGSRLRPLTLHTPKPVVPILDRPFITHQIDLLRAIDEIDEVILSLSYRPERIEAVIGHGEAAGVPIRYVVEPSPLGTGGAVKYVEPHLDGTTIVFNGDVLTAVDLPAVLALHRERRACATIVLTPVENPSAYGLVETDAAGNVRRFLEKPTADQITCDTINAGIYVLEPNTFDRIPERTPYSIEREYFPSLVARGDPFVAHVDRGYWLDIGTPQKYRRGHRDLLDGRIGDGRAAADRRPTVTEGATVDSRARLDGPCFIGARAVIEAGATVGAYAVVGHDAVVAAEAAVYDTIIWPEARVGRGAHLDGAIVGHRCRVGAYARLEPGVVLGDDSILTDYSHVCPIQP